MQGQGIVGLESVLETEWGGMVGREHCCSNPLEKGMRDLGAALSSVDSLLSFSQGNAGLTWSLLGSFGGRRAGEVGTGVPQPGRGQTSQQVESLACCV